MDLVTVLLHEAGHALGLEHGADPHGLMGAVLAPGVRRLPNAAEWAVLAGAASDPAGPPDRPMPFPGLPLAGLTALRLGRGRDPERSEAAAASAPRDLIAANVTLTHGDFARADGWSTTGNVILGNGEGTLAESTTAQTHLSQVFRINPGDRVLRFTLSGAGLQANGAGPGDAFEVALLDAETGAPVAGAVALSYECLVEPKQVVELRAPLEGLIERIHADRGDLVKPGQVLVVLDTGVDRARLDLARYKARMRGPLQAAESRVAFSTKKLDRLERLLRSRFTSAHDRDEAEAEKRLAEAELVAAKDSMEVARLEVREYEEIVRLKSLVSPFAGVVLERRHHAGEVAQVDDQVPILKLAQIDPLSIEVVLPTAALGTARIGDEAIITPEAGLVGPITAKVRAVDPVVDAASGTFGIRLELPNPDHRIPAGIRCQAEFLSRPAGEAGRPIADGSAPPDPKR